MDLEEQCEPFGAGSTSGENTLDGLIFGNYIYIPKQNLKRKCKLKLFFIPKSTITTSIWCFIFAVGVSVSTTVLCALSLCLAALAVVQVKRMVLPQLRPSPKMGINSAVRYTCVDENVTMYEEIDGSKTQIYENLR